MEGIILASWRRPVLSLLYLTLVHIVDYTLFTKIPNTLLLQCLEKLGRAHSIEFCLGPNIHQKCRLDI